MPNLAMQLREGDGQGLATFVNRWQLLFGGTSKMLAVVLGTHVLLLAKR